MHSIVLLTAMTATSGLFGGGRHHQATYSYAPAANCQSGRCGTVATYAPATTCQNGRCPAPAYTAAPVAAPVYAPAPRMAAAPAYNYNAYYYPAATAAAPTCTTGTCPRR